MTERDSIIKFRERSHRPNGVSRFAKILKGKVRMHFAEVFIGFCMWKACKLCKGSVFLYSPGPAGLADEVPWKNPHSWICACLLTQETVKTEGKALL